MTLNDTVVMMNSSDYKERFLAEYKQLQIRIDKLKSMFSAWDAGELSFAPTCPRNLLEAQLNSMEMYAYCLRVRAETEGIEL